MQRNLGQLALFVSVMTTILGGVHYYLWFRLVRSPALPAPWDRRGAWLFAALALTIPFGVVVGWLLDRPLAKVIATAVYVWLGLAILLFFASVATEPPRLLIRIVAWMASGPMGLERRIFLSRVIAGVVSAVGLSAATAGLASALGEIALAHVRVPLRRLPRALSGFRIVQLTDLHIGPTLGASWLAKIVDHTNAAAPDLIVITGDLVDGTVADLRADVAPLARLRARHGVYFVTGNHEYYSGVDEWLDELRRLGVHPLRNERMSIGDGDASFDLAGVDDWSARRHGHGHGADLARALEGRDADRALVLLAHQPKQITEAAQRGVGLQLSGHTHGGQIFPWGLFVRLDQPYVAGLAMRGETAIYVSRGTGFWGPPMRVAAPAEITVIELVAA